MRVVRRLWERVGARPELMDATAHDRLLAWTSHLPQATASALARVLRAASVPRERLGPGGRDMTRLAASSPALWTPIALDNATDLADALAALEGALATLRAALLRGDREAVRTFFDVHDTDRG